MSYRLRNKLLFLSGVIFLLFIVLNGAAALITSSKLEIYLREQGDRDILQKAVEIDRQLRTVISQKQELLSLLAGNVNLSIALKRDRLSLLDELFTEWKRDSDFREFILVDEAGKRISQNGLDSNASVAGESWYQEARRHQTSRIYFEPGEKPTPVFWLLAPLSVRNISYSLLAKVDWQTVPLFLDQSKLVQLQDSNNFCIILDDRYNLLYLPPFLQKVREQLSSSFFSTGPRFEDLRNALQHEEIGSLHEINFSNKANCVGFARLQASPGWFFHFGTRDKTMPRSMRFTGVICRSTSLFFLPAWGSSLF